MSKRKEKESNRATSSREIALEKIFLEYELKGLPVPLALLRSESKKGLASTAVRRKVWPLLLGLDINEFDSDWKDSIISHRYSQQVTRDIERSLWVFSNKNEELLKEKRVELAAMINYMFTHHSELHYFQGYHDIASVFLMVCGDKAGCAMLERVSLFHIRDYLNDSLDHVSKMMAQLLPLLAKIDKPVHNFLIAAQVQPFFALAWVLTWFSHSVDDLGEAARIFDFMLASHPYCILHVAVSVIVHRRSDLLQLNCEYAEVHHFLTKLPPNLPWESILRTAQGYTDRYSPYNLPLSNQNGPPYPFPFMPDIFIEIAESRRRYRRNVVFGITFALFAVSTGAFLYYNRNEVHRITDSTALAPVVNVLYPTKVFQFLQSLWRWNQ